MKKLILAVVLIIISTVYIIATGGTFDAKYSQTPYVGGYSTDRIPISEYHPVIEQDEEVIRIRDTRLVNDTVYVTLEAVNPGRATLLFVTDSEGSFSLRYYYVNRLGIITEDSHFGDCTGGWIIMVSFDIFIAYMLYDAVKRFRESLSRDFYSFHNISLLGIIIILVEMLLFTCLGVVFSSNGLDEAVSVILSAVGTLTLYAIPVTLLALIFVAVTNAVLMVKEGRNKSNLLGTAFCFAILVMLLFPMVLGEWLQRTTLSFIDVHKEFGWGNYIERMIENVDAVVLAYMLCILLGTIIMGALASRRRPAFDKDYIIILGCQIRKDGTLPPLLRGRADAALDFAAQQKSVTGRDVVFVPSGGKGNNEIMAEGEAIANYLESKGIGKDHILIENRSVNTIQNFEYSLALIREREGDKDVNIAFATTNYHTFRSGSIAKRFGIKADGIGSRTKLYFGINAFIRECIATLYYEKKLHIRVLITLIMLAALMVSFTFITLIY
ncbi:DUF218 domain-containing protein [Ruminococcaceae bacterium YRB3002]|nr:DUF218 domain-containing protein [Ruminococcaceae bacterium YRB3002]